MFMSSFCAALFLIHFHPYLNFFSEEWVAVYKECFLFYFVSNAYFKSKKAKWETMVMMHCPEVTSFILFNLLLHNVCVIVQYPI